MNLFKQFCLVLALGIVISSHGWAQNADKDPSCITRMRHLIDRYIDQYRTELGKCEVDEDCVFQAGGSGVHINRNFYGKYKGCFSYANTLADNFCHCGKLETCSSAFGDGIEWGKMPNEYKCKNNMCSPVFYEKVSLERKWKRVGVNNGFIENSESCEKKFKEYFNENKPKR